MAKDMDSYNNIVPVNNDTLLVKKKISNKDIALIVQKTNIIPIDEMRKDDSYRERFTVEGDYNDSIIRNEIKIIDAKDGGNQWLLGERWSLINEEKLFKLWGFKSFSEYIEKDIQFSRAKVYNCISIYNSFSFDETTIIGSKLSLISPFVKEIEDEEERDYAIKEASKLSYKKIQQYISEDIIESVLKVKSSNEIELFPDVKEEVLNSISNNDIVDAEFSVNFKDAVIIVPSKLKDDEPYFSPSNQKKIDSKSHQLQMGFDNEILQKYFSKYIKTKQKEIKSWIEEELSKPKNKEDYEIYKESL